MTVKKETDKLKDRKTSLKKSEKRKMGPNQAAAMEKHWVVTINTGWSPQIKETSEE